MKTLFVCILFGFLGLFIYAADFISQQGIFFIDKSSSQEIKTELYQFRKNSTPLTEINLSELYGESHQFQILHPLLDLKKLVTSSCQNCSEGHVNFDEDPEILEAKKEKRNILEGVLYSGKPLPPDFFSQPPFTDAWGYSFAHLLTLYGAVPNKKWVEDHLSFFKISELPEILERYQIHDPRFSVLSQLGEGEVESIVRGEEFILTKNHVLFKDQQQLGFSPLSYVVYNLSDFKNFIKRGAYDVDTVMDNSTCIVRIGNSCWSYNSHQTQAYFYRYSFVIFLLLGLIVFSFIGFYLKHLYEKNKAQVKQRLSLQVLSHEFRTPVSAMLLMIERMRNDSHQFNEENQDMITRLSAEIYRLQRIIEVSKTYLQTENHQIQFKNIEIPSVNNWMSDFVEEMGKDLKCELLKEDQAFRTDPFWFKFILSNLVQNSLAHGQAPVFIRLKNIQSKLHIAVEDQGRCQFSTLEEMTEAYVKSHRSQGMGLGLNMISFITKEWGVEFDFSNNPTTFTLKVENA